MARQPKAYPVSDDASRAHVATIRRDLGGRYPILHLGGRNGLHKDGNQDHATMAAMLTARNILLGERRHDVWNVNEDAQYAENGVSGARDALGRERRVPRKVA